MVFSKPISNRGFSLVEMIIYVTLLTIISLLVVNTILSFTGSYRHLRAMRSLDDSSISAMERLTREIRNASNVDVGNSAFGSNPGALTIISQSGGISTTTRFYVQNNLLKMNINGAYFGPLTASSTTITNLSFTYLSTGISHGVKIDMTLSATDGPMVKSKTYHSTVILRGQ